jgi:hypothetical protein
MVQAIQVLRFHLLELEKVRITYDYSAFSVFRLHFTNVKKVIGLNTTTMIMLRQRWKCTSVANVDLWRISYSQYSESV